MSVEQKLDEILQKLGSLDSAIDNLYRETDKILQKIDKNITTPSSQAKPAADKTVKINNTEVPAEIAKLIHVAEGGDRYVLTKPWTPHKQDWIDINNFVKDLGGEWVSAGKDSRWEIKKKP